MIVRVDKIELASELAHEKLINECSDYIKIYEDEQACITHYTEQAQEVFNGFYDSYLTIIEKCEQ